VVPTTIFASSHASNRAFSRGKRFGRADSATNRCGYWQIGALQTAVAAQSDGSAQAVRQVRLVPSQAYGVQSVGGVAGAHWPVALQVKWVRVAPEQVVAAQVVPAGWVAHWPAPSQNPVVPQVEGSIIIQTPAGSVPPAATAWQVPREPGTAHELQLPQVELVQQYPSVQLPLKHSAPAVQIAPLAFRLVQTFDMHVKPVAQSPSPPHVVRQAAAPHAYGEQLVGGCTQVPAPLQLPTFVKVDPLQVAVPQVVVAGAFRHKPLPSHFPVKPHGGLAVQPPCGSISAAPTG
jgi:hypothetical protein